MALVFGSKEWIAAYEKAVQGNAEWSKAAATWEGDLTIVVKEKPEIDLSQPIYIHMDLWHGVCRSIIWASKEEGEKAKFVITGEYERWKQVAKKELEPVKGMMQGKLKLRGDLPTIVRALKAAQQLINSLSTIDTVFPDEISSEERKKAFPEFA